MIDFSQYQDEQYSELVALLKSCDLYDEPWETRENLQLKIERDPESIIVALDGENVVGCVFVVVDGWIGMIWRLAVLESHRKHGLGQQLMKKAEALIKNRGVKEASLFVSAPNDKLKEWYHKQGYTIGSDYTFGYKEL